MRCKMFFLSVLVIFPALGMQKKENIKDLVEVFRNLPESERDCFSLSSGEAKHFEIKVGKGIKILTALKIYKDKKWTEVDINNNPGVIKEFYAGDKKEYWYAFVGEPGDFSFVEITRDAYDIMQKRHNSGKAVCPGVGPENCAEKCTRWLCDCLKDKDNKKLCSDKHISCIDDNCKIKHYGTDHKNRPHMNKDQFPRKVAIINLSSYRTEFCIGHEDLIVALNKGMKFVGKSIARTAESVSKGAVKTLEAGKTIVKAHYEASKCIAKFIKFLVVIPQITAGKFLDILAGCLNNLRHLTIEANEQFIAGVTKPVRDILKIKLVTSKEAPLTTGVSDLKLQCKEVKVRKSTDPISSQEHDFRVNRDLSVKNAQDSLLGIKHPLMITTSGSGGGIRAALGHLGHMLALKESGLLDTVTYASGLSGSTWLLSGWLQQNQTLEQFKDLFINRIAGKENIIGLLQNLPKGNKKDIKNLIGSSGLLADIIDNVVTKWAFAEPYNIVDFYGSLIGWLTLPHKTAHESGIQRQYLSAQRQQIKDGQNPMPIYTAQWYKDEANKAIVEFTPYEIGSKYWKSFINCDGFGRKYLDGKSTNCAPPQSVGFLQGIWGSAFAARVADIWNEFKESKAEILGYKLYDKKSEISNQIQKLMDNSTDFAQFQTLRGASVMNFMQQLPDSPVSEDRILMIDGAIGWINTPIFALYRDSNGKKAPDVIFMFDYQVRSKNNNLKDIKAGYSYEFDMMDRYAKANQLPFPKLDVDKLVSDEKDSKGNLISKINTMTIFQDEDDLSKPLIIFLPLVGAYSDNYATFKFNYSKNEAEFLVNLTKNNLMQNLDKIKEAIKKRANKIAMKELAN